MSFRMLVLGDSILWGQGLTEAQKATTQAAEFIKQARGTDVIAARYARSGADVWNTGESILDKLSPFPGLLPRIDPALDDVTIENSGNVANTQTARDATGEVPNTRPFALRQLLAAREGLHGQDVDLVITDGGINDVAVENIVLPYKSAARLEARTNSFKGYMALLLDRIHATFPAARIVVTGYYAIVSPDSNIGRLLDFGTELLGRTPPEERRARGLDAPLASMNTARLADRQRQSLMLRNIALRNEATLAEPVDIVEVLDPMKSHMADLSRTFADTLHTVVQADVDAFNQRVGAVARYAIPDIPRQHAIFTADPWIFGLGPDLRPEDDMAGQRAAECVGGDPVSAFVCQRASLGHPNPMGSKAYATAIRKALQDLGVI